LIFDLYNKGRGAVSVLKELVKRDIKPFGRSKGWQPMTVHRILESKSAIGYNDFVEPPIKGYYPPVITEEVFYKAQLQRKKNHTDRGRKGDKELNLFGGLCKCGSCSGSMIKYYAQTKDGKKYHYLRCFNSKIGLCKSRMTDFNKFNETFLLLLNNMEFTALLFTKKQPKDNSEMLQGKIIAIQKVIERIADAIEKSESKTLVSRLAKLEIEKNRLESDYESAMAEKMSRGDVKAEYRELIHDMMDRLKENDFRVSLRTLIRKHISLIVVNQNEYTIYLKSSNDYISVALDKRSFSLKFGKWEDAVAK
jgi:uncharacterized protein (UPF0335 family)